MFTTAAARRPESTLYRRVWRWHFYACLGCLPFLALMAMSVVAKKQVERLRPRCSPCGGAGASQARQHIAQDHKYPEVVWRVVLRHVIPVIGKLAVSFPLIGRSP